MPEFTDLSRRGLITLGATGAAGGALVLAGCSNTNEATPSDSGTSDAPTPSDGDASAAASGTVIARLDEVPVGGSIDATLDGEPILVSRPSDDEVVAFSAICTHQGCIVAAAGAELDCPCHNSRFAADTGAVLGGPALEPLPSVAVAISGDEIVSA